MDQIINNNNKNQIDLKNDVRDLHFSSSNKNKILYEHPKPVLNTSK